MKRKILLPLACILFCAKISLNAATPSISPAPAPDWIAAVEPEGNPPGARDFSGGYYLSFTDLQYNLDMESTYIRMIRNIESESGVENGSEVSVTFDPVYERVEFHYIKIFRDGKVAASVPVSEFKVAPVETERQRLIYNGTYMASAVLKDVRKGDRIDIAYSVKGWNPVFKGKFSRSVYFGAFDYISHMHRAIIASPDRKLRFRNFGQAPERKESARGRQKVYEWDLKNIRATPYEDYMPSWFEKDPFVQVSEYESWEEVVSWGLEFYSDAGVSGALAGKVKELIAEAEGSELAYVHKAIRFVQDEVRYFGIETGENSHRPHRPATVLDQRFGDCKDKTLLLCAMLRAHNIEASPVLIDTYLKTSTLQLLPAPTDFNHVICRIKVAPGPDENPGPKEYFFVDPTYNLQGGSLRDMHCPDYGKGLVLKPGEKELTAIPARNAGSIQVKEEITVHPRSSPDAGEMMVWTDFSGGEADNIRYSFQSARLSETEKSYLNYYRELFPQSKIELSDSLEFFDDRGSRNEFTIVERYTIRDQWYPEESTNSHVIRIRPQSFSERLPVIPNRDREYPVALKYPLKLAHQVNVRLPAGNWRLDDESYALERDSYRLSYRADFDRKTNSWSLRYEYETFRDHVPANEAAQLRKDVNRIKENLDYELSEPGLPDFRIPSADRINAWMILLFFAALAAGAFYCLKLYREAAGPGAPGTGLVIGSWLILMAIGIVLNPAGYLYRALFSPEAVFYPAWEPDPDAGIAYLAISLADMVANTFLFCGSILMIALFFKRRSAFPALYVNFMWLSFLAHVFAMAFLQMIRGGDFWIAAGGGGLIRELIGATVWTMYLQKSNRVRKTFVNNPASR